MRNKKRNQSGLTLIEVILSIAIMAMITVTLMTLFVTSSKINNKSEITLDSTYLGKDAMELSYELSKDISYDKLEMELGKRGYVFNESENSFGKEYNDKRYLEIKLNEEGNLIRVEVRVYKDENKSQLQVQYESLYSWVGRGILSEKE